MRASYSRRAQFQPAELGGDHDLDAVQRRPFRLVIADKAIVGDLVEIVPIFVQFEIEDETARRRHQFTLVFDANLSFGKARDLAQELLPRPRVVHRREALFLHGAPTTSS